MLFLLPHASFELLPADALPLLSSTVLLPGVAPQSADVPLLPLASFALLPAGALPHLSLNVLLPVSFSVPLHGPFAFPLPPASFVLPPLASFSQLLQLLSDEALLPDEPFLLLSSFALLFHASSVLLPHVLHVSLLYASPLLLFFVSSVLVLPDDAWLQLAPLPHASFALLPAGVLPLLSLNFLLPHALNVLLHVSPLLLLLHELFLLLSSFALLPLEPFLLLASFAPLPHAFFGLLPVDALPLLSSDVLLPDVAPQYAHALLPLLVSSLFLLHDVHVLLRASFELLPAGVLPLLSLDVLLPDVAPQYAAAHALPPLLPASLFLLYGVHVPLVNVALQLQRVDALVLLALLVL